MSDPSPSEHGSLPHDSTFRLTADERARLFPWYDADALERLLQRVPPETRAGILEPFTVPQERGQQRPLLVDMGHPKLQAILDEVWVPFWEAYSEEEMDEHPDYFPGRELAKRRRRGESMEDPPSGNLSS